MKDLKHLLIVDDDIHLTNRISSYLLSYGFWVNIANNVYSALALIKKSKPDLIISDIMMTNLDGYDFIKLLKVDKNLACIPFIFLTAKGMTNDKIKGYNLGCYAYMSKPFNPEELIALIRSVFYHINIYCLYQQYTNNTSKPYIEIGYSFTSREKTVLQLLLKGYMNKEIAIKLNLSVRNVEKYVSKLLNKTHTRNRTQLVKFIMENYIVHEYKGE